MKKWLLQCLSPLPLLVTAASAGAQVSFHDDVKPLLAVHCYKCHGPETQKSELRLDDKAAALRGGKSGAAIVAGAAEKSELLRRVLSHDPDEQMPPTGARLTTEELSRLRQWIDAGAPWPERDDYWAFQPPRNVPVPEGRAAHPIDRFLEARLAAEGLTPVPAADARTLLRRTYFDLVGMPPTPEDAAEFLRNPRSPESTSTHAALVDKLLADPRHGERWARHWLDLVRYGESDGYEDDKVRPLAWRYRDYVVRSFNADKPYDRFVQEQIAG